MGVFRGGEGKRERVSVYCAKYEKNKRGYCKFEFKVDISSINRMIYRKRTMKASQKQKRRAHKHGVCIIRKTFFY